MHYISTCEFGQKSCKVFPRWVNKDVFAFTDPDVERTKNGTTWREREKKLLEEQGEEENVFVCIVDVGGTLCCCCEGHFDDLHKCRNTPFNK